YFLPLLLVNRNRKNMEVVAQGKMLPSLRESLSMLGTFSLTVLAWIFFRAESVGHAISYLGGIFSPSIVLRPEVLPIKGSFLVLIFMSIEWLGRNSSYAIQQMAKFPSIGRWVGYTIILGMIYFFGKFSEEIEFIYFQF